jgi:DNA-directed RNA polymerase subunit RPC12/RpoP
MIDSLPACFRCDSPFTVKRVHPLSAGFEARTFRCPKCDHHLVLVASTSDPMDSLENRLTSR